MIFESLIFDIFVKVHVIHSLPGRIRMHIPQAKKIPKEWQFEKLYFDVVKKIKGVKDISFSYTTGNALLEYDNKITSEDEILRFLNKMASIAARHQKQLGNYGPDKKEEAMEYLLKIWKPLFEGIV